VDADGTKGWPQGFFLLDARLSRGDQSGYFGRFVPHGGWPGVSGSFLLRTAVLDGLGKVGAAKSLTVNTCRSITPRAYVELSSETRLQTVVGAEARSRVITARSRSVANPGITAHRLFGKTLSPPAARPDHFTADWGQFAKRPATDKIDLGVGV